MHDVYDIFEQLPDGTPLWTQTANTIEDARERVSSLAKAKGEHFAIYHAREGRFVTPFPTDATKDTTK
jgi:hypothetical protein